MELDRNDSKAKKSKEYEPLIIDPDRWYDFAFVMENVTLQGRTATMQMVDDKELAPPLRLSDRSRKKVWQGRDLIAYREKRLAQRAHDKTANPVHAMLARNRKRKRK
jgi:hypothetical protein